MDAAMLVTLTTMSVAIGLTLSCIPMNQPLNAIRPRVAGAAQMRMRKYLLANSFISGVLPMQSRASLRKSGCSSRSSSEQPRAMVIARTNTRPHSTLSPEPNAWAVRPPVPTRRNAKFQ